MMETVGLYLKKERESKNISLGELSRLTKISELYLAYIENDEFEKLPQGPYAKGYIASYSRLIGGDADEAISLYEALNKKPIQTEDTQPESSAHNGRKSLPEKVKATERKEPKATLFGKAKSFFNTAASSVPINRFSFKAAGSSIKNIVSSIRVNLNWIDNAGSFFTKIASSKSWLYAFAALLGIAILVLAGFGFYHLFIYDPNPLQGAELQHVQDEEKRSLPAVGSEKSAIRLPTTDPSATSEQPKGHAGHTERVEMSNPPETPKQSTPPSTDPDTSTPRTELKPEDSIAASNPVKQTDTLLSSSSSTVEDADSGRTTAGTESQVHSSQSGKEEDQSPASTAVDAPIKVLQASVCSAIKNRMPAGVDTSFPISIQKVYVWNAIEANQTPSKIRHIYFLNGETVSDVTLDVRSTYWRTWSSKSISRDRDRGEWRVDIVSTNGKVLRRLYFEVR